MMQQKTSPQLDYISALTLAQKLLRIQPDSSVLVEYASGLLFSSAPEPGSRRKAPITLPPAPSALSDQSSAWQRYLEVSRQYPGVLVVVERHGTRIIGQYEPRRPAFGAPASRLHAAPQQV